LRQVPDFPVTGSAGRKRFSPSYSWQGVKSIGESCGTPDRLLATSSIRQRNASQGSRHFNLPIHDEGMWKEADFMKVLARLKDKFHGLPSAFVTSSE